MADFKSCMQGHVSSGGLTQRQADNLVKKYEALKKKYIDLGQSAGAAEKAANDVISLEATIIDQKKRNVLQHALKQKEISDQLDAMPGPIESKVADLYQRTAFRADQIKASSYAMMDSIADKIKGNFLDLKRDYKTFEQGLRVALGEASENADAKAIGKVIKDVFDYTHQRYRNAGGIIGKLENYFPQVHRAEEIRKVSSDEWIDFVLERVDLNKMIDVETGAPFTPERLREVLSKSYEDIVTDGRASMKRALEEGKVSGGMGKGGVDTARSDSRFIHFKDADAFLEYNSKFGTGEKGLINSFLGHVDGISKDIAMLETLGPKPDAMSRFLDFKMGADGVNKVKKSFVNSQYRVLRGLGYGDTDGIAWKIVNGSHNLMRSAMLGAASLSAISDTAFIAATAKINGLSATKAMGNYAKLLSGVKSKELKEIAARSGFLVDVINGSVLADTRFASEMMQGKFTRTLAGLTNKLSGLHAMTKATQDGIALEGLSAVGDMISKKTPWEKLNGDFREALSRYGLTKDDWVDLQKAKLMETESGAKFLISADLRVDDAIDVKRRFEIANKIDDWVFGLRQSAANEASLASRAITTGAVFGDGAPGSLSRMLASSIFMFKTFPITVIATHLLPAIKRARVQRKFDHLAMITIGTSLLGAGAMQLKEMSKGKTPKDVEDHKFWIAAMMQGGGLGLFGDFLLGDYSRFGRSPITEMTGPVFGTLDDIFRATKGNFDQFADGRDPDLLRDIFRTMKRNIPLGSLWYLRLGLERTVLDNIERMIDPKFDSRIRKIERRMFKENKQKFWWRPGKAAP